MIDTLRQRSRRSGRRSARGAGSQRLARPLPPVLAVALAVLAGCGGGSDGGRPATGISEEDVEIVSRIRGDVRDWNRAAAPWVRAFGGEDLERFLRVHRGSLKPLHVAASGIEGGALQIEDERLRLHFVQLGDAYRAEFNRIVDIGDHAEAGDLAAVRRALRKLRRVNRRKGELAERLADDFPELGRDF
jgi:hypothetical protein